MATATPRPTDEELEDFLLGTLPEEKAERVGSWAESTPGSAHRLNAMSARDILTDALATVGPDDTPAPLEVERIIALVGRRLALAPPP